MNNKPKVYIVTNLGGGVRKSTTIAHLTFALQDRGENPLIVALDTNGTLQNLLEDGTEIVQWDLNNSEDAYDGLQAVIDAAEDTGRPVVMDLAALGGESLGIHTILETYMLEDCEVISMVPVMPTDKSIKEGIKALNLVNPNKWILVQYGTRNHTRLYERMDEMQDLLALKPNSIIQPAELTDGQVEVLQSESLALNKINETSVPEPKTRRSLKVHMRYWENLSKQYELALQNLTPKASGSKKSKETAATT